MSDRPRFPWWPLVGAVGLFAGWLPWVRFLTAAEGVGDSWPWLLGVGMCAFGAVFAWEAFRGPFLEWWDSPVPSPAPPPPPTAVPPPGEMCRRPGGSGSNPPPTAVPPRGELEPPLAPVPPPPAPPPPTAVPPPAEMGPPLAPVPPPPAPRPTRGSRRPELRAIPGGGGRAPEGA